VRAPALDSELGWLNTDRPLRLDGDLSGRIVVLDFWTYCCINCIHILPDLAYLEAKYAGDPIVFIGVHSAKFANEASRETIRAAMLRYEIQHPVVIDDDMRLWRAYTVRSWPTVVVIDPRGYIAGTFAGEGHRAALDQTLEQLLGQARADGSLADGPLHLRREASVEAASGLAFPGKVLADVESDRLFIADSNHNRIVIAGLPDESGHAVVHQVVGTGTVGRDDGPADRATFHHPQGLAAAHGKLYVADTENHLIRAIDLRTYEVSTIVGTGEMTYDWAGGGRGTAQGINSPWDLTIEGSTLYCAMAGTHQIWRIDLPVGFARALAGSGRENIVDGPTERAALAQPSGICALDGNLYFADSEVSAIRGIDMAAERVFTVIGQGLFVFGDVDGSHPDARLQHPLGVAAWQRALLVADTYNHKIKLVSPAARSIRTLYGSGRPETSTADERPAFFEPGGLSVAGDRLFVADTNNHRVVCVNLQSHAWCEVSLAGLTAPRSSAREAAAPHRVGAIAPSADGLTLEIAPSLAAGVHLSGDAPWSVRVACNGRVLAQKTGKSDTLPLQVAVDVSVVPAEGDWRVEAAFAVCTSSDRGLCAPVRMSWIVPVQGGGNDRRCTLGGVVPMPEGDSSLS
jgi:thiol-disulfide isomerase/thioredoxin